MAIVSATIKYFYKHKIDYVADTLSELQNNPVPYYGSIVYVKDVDDIYSVNQPVSFELNTLTKMDISAVDPSNSHVDFYYMTPTGLQTTNNLIQFFSPVFINSVGIIGGITENPGIATIYVNTTGTVSGVPLFNNLNNCDIQLTPYAASLNPNDIYFVDVLDINNTTGLLRVTAVDRRGNSPPNGIRINCRIIGAPKV